MKETDGYIETTNKAQLISAIKACPYGSITTVINRGANGRVTRFKIGGCHKTEEDFEKGLRVKVSNIKRIPAYVWC